MTLAKPYEKMTEAEQQEQTRLDIIGLTVSGIAACAKSLLAPENLKDVTPADLKVLNKIYRDVLRVQQRVVCGADIDAEDARFAKRLRAVERARKR